MGSHDAGGWNGYMMGCVWVPLAALRLRNMACVVGALLHASCCCPDLALTRMSVAALPLPPTPQLLQLHYPSYQLRRV